METISSRVAVAIVAISLVLTIAHTLAVADVMMRTDPTKRGIVAPIAKSVSSRFPTRRGSTSSVVDAAMGQLEMTTRGPSAPGSKTQVSAGSKKFRHLHWILLVAHAVAIAGHIALLLKFALPVSKMTCNVPHQFLIAFVLLFDGVIVTFLLAKVDVTNASRSRACWETVVVWVSRIYAWLYIPASAIWVPLVYQGGVSDDGTYCVRYMDTEELRRKQERNVEGYIWNVLLVTVQLLLLLILFLRPLLGKQDYTQSGGEIYKRVVKRNVVATFLIVIAYLITAVGVVSALIHETPANDKASTFTVVPTATNMLVVFILIEITLPVGFISAWKTIRAESSMLKRDSREMTMGLQTTL